MGYHIEFNNNKKSNNYFAFGYGFDMMMKYDINRFSIGTGIGLYMVFPGKIPIKYNMHNDGYYLDGYLTVEEISINLPLDITYRFLDKYQSFFAVGGMNIALGNISNSYDFMDINEQYISSEVLDYSDLFKNEISRFQMK